MFINTQPQYRLTTLRQTHFQNSFAALIVAGPSTLRQRLARSRHSFSLGRRLLIKFSSESNPTSKNLFKSQESTWDHVFSDIKDMPPLVPATAHPNRSTTTRRPRKQVMTAREIAAFDDMFNMIFSAVQKQKEGPKHASGADVGIGRGKIGDLFGKLRRHSKKMKWTTEADEVLDRKKEEMDLCDTDHQLLNWAMKEVFGESERYEMESRKAMAEAAESGPGAVAKELPMLQPSTYPHLVALLIRTFRDKYNDPHLALSIFEHARHLSIASYVFGCSTMAYNELIETRWTCFRDLKGVYDALVEMSVNGVDTDSRTRKLVEVLRREVGEQNLWVEEDALGNGEVWSMLTKIEELVKKRTSWIPESDEPAKASKWDDWKALPMEDEKGDGWGFDQWNDPPPRRDSWRP